MIRPKPDIPERVPVLSFPTPEGQSDLLFYEVRDGDLPKNKIWAYGDPHPDSAEFPHHELVFVTAEGGAGWQRWYYAATRENQHRYNWQVTDTTDWPQMSQTFLVKRDAFSPSESYPMPPAQAFPYPLEWSVTGVEERQIGDEVLASLYVTVVVTRERLRIRQVIASPEITTTAGSKTVVLSTPVAPVGSYIECPHAFLLPGTQVLTTVPPASVTTFHEAFSSGTFPAEVVQYVANAIVGKEFDPDTNSLSTYRREKVPAGTSIPSGIQADGSIAELQPVNTLWAIKTTKQAAGLAGSAINGLSSRTFQVITNWAWPAVLEYVKITPVYADDADIYSAVTGYITAPIFAADAYSGPCLATIIERWTSKLPVIGGDPTWDSTKLTSPYLPEPTPLLPKRISFDSPLLNVSVPECLHDYITFYAANFQQEYPATNYTRWPGSIVAEVDLQAHQGGWLTRIMLVNAPSLAGTAPDLHLSVTETLATSFRLAWTNLSGTTALKLDVSTDPSFKTGFLSIYRDLSVLGETELLVEGASRGVPYYCRLTVTRTVGAGSVTSVSNIVAVMCPPQPEIAVYALGPDATANTSDDVLLPSGTGVVNFGNALTNVGTTRSVVLRNNGLLSLSGITFDFAGDYEEYFSVVGSLPASIPPGGTAVVQMRLLPTSPVGAVSVALTVGSNATNYPAYALTLTGTAVQPEIDVQYGGTSYGSGSTIALGNVNTGDVQTFTFSVLNTGNGPLTAVISAVDGGSPIVWTLLAAPESTINGGASSTFAVSFAPLAAGTRTMSISIDNNDPDDSEDPYLLTLSATGVAVGRIAVESPDGDFLAPAGDYYFGLSNYSPPTTKPATFTIHNNGVGTLNSLSAALSGPDAADFSLGALATSIAPGGSTTLVVSFTPTTVGSKSAVLTISSSDPGQPTFTVDLTGAGGVDKEIQVEYPSGVTLVDATSRIPFGSLLTSTTRTIRIWLRNVGNDRLHLSGNSVSGGDAAKFTVSALTSPSAGHLDPGESGYFDITLIPGTTVGPLSTTLTILSDDADEGTFTLELFGFAYAAGSLSTYQPSTLVLGQASATADVEGTGAAGLRSVYSRESNIAVSSSGRVAISDTACNRVLIWNSYADLATGKAADLVLGQPSFSECTGGLSATKLFAPKAVAWYGTKLLVGDGVNNRILIWDNPTTSGAAANLVLGQTSFTVGTGGVSLTKFKDITSIFVVPNPDPSGSGKAGMIVAADPSNHRVMVWTTFPTVNGAAATYVLGQTSATVSAPPSAPSYTSGGITLPRFYSPSGVCVSPSDGRLYIADTVHYRVLVYSSIPTSSATPPSAVLFQSSLSSVVSGGATSRDRCGLVRGVSVNTAGQLAVADPDSGRVLLFYSPASTGSLPDAVLGQPDFTTGSIVTRSQFTLTDAGKVFWRSGDLAVMDRNRACIFKP